MKSQRERMMQYVEEEYGSEMEYLWTKYPDYAVCRHPASKKWYAVFMRVPGQKLGLEEIAEADILDVKCSTIMVGSLLEQRGFLPAYHMNKENWISVILDDTVPDEEITLMLELSYDSVAPKRKK